MWRNLRRWSWRIFLICFCYLVIEKGAEAAGNPTQSIQDSDFPFKSPNVKRTVEVSLFNMKGVGQYIWKIQNSQLYNDTGRT